MLLHSLYALQKYIQEARKSVGPGIGDMSVATIAHTNWKFVETLLKEVKSKVMPVYQVSCIWCEIYAIRLLLMLWCS